MSMCPYWTSEAPNVLVVTVATAQLEKAWVSARGVHESTTNISTEDFSQ